MPSLSECLKKKRIAVRNSNAEYRCMKVNAVVKDGKIISISSFRLMATYRGKKVSLNKVMRGDVKNLKSLLKKAQELSK